MGMTAEALGALATLTSVAAGGVTAAFAWVGSKDKRAQDAEREIERRLQAEEISKVQSSFKQEKDHFVSVIDSIRLELRREQEERQTLEKNMGTAWTKIDDLRDTSVRKAELKEYRAEVKQDMKDLGDRLERAIRDAMAAINTQRGHVKLAES